MLSWLSDRHVRAYAKEESRYYEILRQREESQMNNKDHIERTKRMIEVMQAYADGERIEQGDYEKWKYNRIPNWDWRNNEYRVIKPECK